MNYFEVSTYNQDQIAADFDGVTTLKISTQKSKDFIEWIKGAAWVVVRIRYSKTSRNCSHSYNNMSDHQMSSLDLFYIPN